MNFFRKHRLLKNAKELLRQSKHFRNMREDILPQTELEAIIKYEQEIQQALQSKNEDQITKATQQLQKFLLHITPVKRNASLREHFEVMAVAIAIAMALRAYFIQPFKIPTGSMQPTLYGITSEMKEKPDWTDMPPAKFVKWLVFGEWYKDIRTKSGGHLFADIDNESFQQVFRIGNTRYYIPRDAVMDKEMKFKLNEYVPAKTRLWAGIVHAGDHVFVDKFTWNFRKPKRGEIVVFETKDIHGLPPNTHYIKRLIALPRETVSIKPPEVIINGEKITEPRIRKIAESSPGYLIPPPYAVITDPRAMNETNNTVIVPEDNYFVLGDNTKSSRDSRYWGTVPAQNMVGRAFFVYWPFSQRWGIVR